MHTKKTVFTDNYRHFTTTLQIMSTTNVATLL